MWRGRLVLLIGMLVLGVGLVLPWPWLRPSWRDAIEKIWSAWVLRILRVRVRVQGDWPPPGSLLAVNHVSWVDVQALNAIGPSAFVAKSEIARWPLAGFMTRRTGTIFIERGRRHAVKAAVAAVTAALRVGRRVAVFPEGTTGDGTALLPFHGNLLQSACDAQVPVYPVALCYTDAAGRFTTAPAFVGEQTLLENIRVLLTTPQGFGLSIQVLEPVAPGGTRQALTAQARARIEAALVETRAVTTRLP
ncbi:MAG: lysophospholipid acyltransferase family protein [Burkholderiaceae bacterium]|jgi:1-acyl-sn-glycerol-3-phosphate acyltransferase